MNKIKEDPASFDAVENCTLLVLLLAMTGKASACHTQRRKNKLYLLNSEKKGYKRERRVSCQSIAEGQENSGHLSIIRTLEVHIT